METHAGPPAAAPCLDPRRRPAWSKAPPDPRRQPARRAAHRCEAPTAPVLTLASAPRGFARPRNTAHGRRPRAASPTATGAPFLTRIQGKKRRKTREYIHRVGRTARGINGRGHALLILRPEELGFLRYLKQARVPLSEFEFSWSKISDIQSQLEKLIEKNYFLHKSAQEAYKAYIRAYDSHSLKQIYNVNNLDLPKVSLSFGFKVPPFVDLNVNSNHGRRLQKRGGGGGFGYQKAKNVHKAKIFKHISKKSDHRQFSR